MLGVTLIYNIPLNLCSRVMPARKPKRAGIASFLNIVFRDRCEQWVRKHYLPSGGIVQLCCLNAANMVVDSIAVFSREISHHHKNPRNTFCPGISDFMSNESKMPVLSQRFRHKFATLHFNQTNIPFYYLLPTKFWGFWYCIYLYFTFLP